MITPQVSIIIPTHNRASWLTKTLQSVVAQSFEDWELLVVDDASTDHTKKEVRRFPQARYVCMESQSGVSAARNRGVKETSGRWLCFLDSDDLWVRNKLAVQMEWMRSHPRSVVCYTDEIWIRNGVRVNPMDKHRKYSGDIFERALPLCIVSPSSVMIDRAVFAQIGGFDESLPACEDYDLWLRMAARYHFDFIPEKLIVKQGGHSDQLSRKYWGMDRFRVQALGKLIQDSSLKPEYRRLALQTAIQKATILTKGFAKRGKAEDAKYFETLVQKYSQQLESNYAASKQV